MPKRRGGKSNTPGVLDELSPSIARRFLERYRLQLQPAGVFGCDPFDAEALAIAIGDTRANETLSELVVEIEIIEELARERYHDLLQSRAKVLLDSGDGTPTTADLVVLLLIHNRDSLEEIYAERLLVDHHALQSHMPPPGTVPGIIRDPAEVQDAMREAVETELVEREACGGVKIYVFPSEAGFRLVIRRGDPLRRLAAIDPGSGKRRQLRFHKENFDTIEYRCATGELRTHVGSIVNTKMYKKVIGQHVFGNPLLFVTDGPPAKYCLDPIHKLGAECLSCRDVPELERVQLIGLAWEYFPPTDLRLRGSARKNIFESLRMASVALNATAKLTSARFKFTFRDRATATASIRLPNTVSISNKSVQPVIDSWFELRNFTQKPKEATRGLAHPALATP